MQPILREGRVVWDLVIQIQPAEPSIGEVQFDFLGQPAFRTQPIAVSDDEHAAVRDRLMAGRSRYIGLQLLVNIGHAVTKTSIRHNKWSFGTR